MWKTHLAIGNFTFGPIKITFVSISLFTFSLLILHDFIVIYSHFSDLKGPSNTLQSSSDALSSRPCCPAPGQESQNHTKNPFHLLIVSNFTHILSPNLPPLILVTVPGLYLGIQCKSKSNSSSLSQPCTYPSQLSDTPGPSLFPTNQPSLYLGFHWYVYKFPQHFGHVLINTLQFVYDK